MPSSCSLQLGAVGGLSDAHETAVLDSSYFSHKSCNGMGDGRTPLVFYSFYFHCIAVPF